MNAAENNKEFIAAAAEYILDNFEETDRIAMLVLNRRFAETVRRITSVQKAASPEFQSLASLQEREWLGHPCYVE